MGWSVSLLVAESTRKTFAVNAEANHMVSVVHLFMLPTASEREQDTNGSNSKTIWIFPFLLGLLIAIINFVTGDYTTITYPMIRGSSHAEGLFFISHLHR